MNKPPSTSKLFVNLSASQTRKRLKGHGFGVKRVEAIDRHQAVVVHTATGQHLQELLALFPAETTTTSQTALDTPIENLPNLGPATAGRLREIGVDTRSDLERLGALAAFQLVRQRQAPVSLNLLWALVAALRNVDWRTLPEAEKLRLRKELQEF